MIKNILVKLFGSYLSKKAELYDGTPTEGKAWYKSKTVIAGIIVGLRGLYETVSYTMTLAGKPALPAIPKELDSILAILGLVTIQGRVSASQPIVVDEDSSPKNQ